MMENINSDMFKAYDIRTKHGKLNPDLKLRLCRSIVKYYREVLQSNCVIICRDARLYVPELAELLASCFIEAGMDVLLNPLPVSTCQFYFTCMKYRNASGVMLTASHNPGEYVGMKLMAPDVFPLAFGYGPEGGIEKIRNYYEKGNFENSNACKSGTVTVINELNSYIDYSMQLANVKPGDFKGLKILFEFFSGSVGAEIALAFQKAGADITCRNIVPNGFFPQGDPNPIIETSIAPARRAMKDKGYDIGFCFDGDGDRLDVMDSNGNQIVPGLNMSAIISEVMKIYDGKKKEFYADVKAIPSSLIEIAKSGANIHIIRNGHSFIKAKLKDNCDKGYFACEEESAHYYANFPFDINDKSKGYAAVENTLFFALLSAKCFKNNPEKYQNLIKVQNSIYREREWPLYCDNAPEKMQEILDAVEQKMKQLGASVVKLMDDGSDLDAVLMRFNLPEKINQNSSLENVQWCQVAQRISRSEDAMARWEVVSNNSDLCSKMNGVVREITDKYVKDGFASYQ